VTIRVSLEPNACARLATVDALGAADLTDCFGLFRSRKDALKALTDIARSQRLCLKVLGLEQSAGSCFAYQLGKCRGACVGKEPLALHGMRLQLALSALKLKAWPFPGRVALRERDDGGGADLHVCEDWAYLGTARSDEDLADLCAADLHRPFDADVYRILVRHFAGKQKLDWLDLRAAIRCA